MSSLLCFILAAFLLFIGLLVFAGLLLWCETFQTAKSGGTAPADTKNEAPQGGAEAENVETAATTDDASDETGADGDGLPDIATSTPEQAAAAFSEELDAGFARQDDALGIIYNQRPDAVDDLRLIKGVANVLEQKLHNSGIHRFKQIAMWTDIAADEFGAKLSFRDRIFRDDWIAQAKRFHEDKYGEKL